MTCIRCHGIGHIKHHQKQTLIDYTLTCSTCGGTGGDPLVCYAGIGSRKTPEPVQQQMSTVGMQLAMRGYTLRSGRAVGADQAFESGCDMMRGRKVIRTRTNHQAALDHAAQFHPTWDNCSDVAKQLHARNSQVMLGDHLDHPVRFVVCWTPGGAITGGTGQALRIAAYYNITVFNLAITPLDELWSAL